MHATIPLANLVPIDRLEDIEHLGNGFFYTTADNGTVSLWHADEGDTCAIRLAQRHPGTSGKDAATIANDMLLGG